MAGRYPQGEGRDDQIRRSARVLAIIQQIWTAPACWSRRRLAEHYELTERMIQLDLYRVRHLLGLPLRRGDGGYYFERLPQLPAAGYSFSEALALLTAARAAQAIPGVNSGELAAAIARLECIFPDELRTFVSDAAARLPRHAVRAHRQEMLAVLHRGLVEGRQLDITYATGSRGAELSQRIVEPYDIMPYGRSWHLIAFDHLRSAVRQFKVDRVEEAELLETRYRIPADFDLAAYLGDAWGLMRGAAGPAEDVVLLFQPEAGRRVAEEAWHASQSSQTLPDGRVRLAFHCGITPEMVSWLLYYGSHVWVETPVSLREKVAAEHERALALEG